VKMTAFAIMFSLSLKSISLEFLVNLSEWADAGVSEVCAALSFLFH